MFGHNLDARVTGLVFYEYCLTLHTEVQEYWDRELTTSSMLFFVNRYASLANRVAVISAYILLGHGWSMQVSASTTGVRLL